MAIGNFDGLHLGHRTVIAAMRQAAQARKLVPSVLTFEPHPRRFFMGGVVSFRLERVRDKLAGLAALGVARVYAPSFNAAFAAIPAAEFLDRVLYQQLGARAVVTGEDFVFGHRRGGDVEMLKQWGSDRGVEIITVPGVALGDKICSSSAIRQAVTTGDMEAVAQMLGCAYRLTGRVVHGDGRGKKIGFPTANIALAPGLLLPKTGVYAVMVDIGGQEYHGVANFGYRPTIGVDAVPKFEVHLFDNTQNLYGKRLAVSFIEKIRDEQKFDSLANLTAQISLDCARAHSILETAHVQ